MINIIRSLTITIVLSLVMMAQSMAGTILYGTVRNNPNRVNIDESEIFPANLYRFYLDAYNLKYDNTMPLKDRVENLNQFSLSLSGDLNLISFDRKTGVTKFKLIVEAFNSLSYHGKTDPTLVFTGGTFLINRGFFKPLLKLADGSEPEFIIEGKLEMINDKAKWISFNRNKYFDIEVTYFDNYVINQKYYNVKLKLLRDFPVIVTDTN